jgi:zinc/manganese transport system substrate-binding protein
MIRVLLVIALIGHFPLAAAELKVAVLHPLLVDLAHQVGGNKVEVVDLIGPNGDPHHFEPKPADIKKAENARIYLLAGMGLEGYLPKLQAIIAGRSQLVEVGATLPALEGACEHEGHAKNEHEHGIDPHWWHSIDLFRRATGVVAEAFAKQSPNEAEYFRKNAESYRLQLDELERWAKHEIATIPRERRHLATSHAAFQYFCKDFGFTAHPLQGVNREQMPSPQEISDLVSELKKQDVRAIFPERESNPKILGNLTLDTGIRLGDPLIADGTGGVTYIEMVRHNVNAIVKALAQ